MRVRHLAEDQTEYLKKWLNTRLLLHGALPLRAETDRIDNRRSAWLTVKALLRPTHLNALFLTRQVWQAIVRRGEQTSRSHLVAGRGVARSDRGRRQGSRGRARCGNPPQPESALRNHRVTRSSLQVGQWRLRNPAHQGRRIMPDGLLRRARSGHRDEGRVRLTSEDRNCRGAERPSYPNADASCQPRNSMR